jgi:LysR family transcriptional regulator, nitrogen assimilation regulatory protein
MKAIDTRASLVGVFRARGYRLSAVQFASHTTTDRHDRSGNEVRLPSADMDFRQIRYFIAIAEQGSLSAAADAIHIAQPALSTQIANLEAELGVRLFERHGRGVKLTPVGALFLRHAYIIRDDFAAAKATVTASLPAASGVVYAGLPMTTSTVLAVPMIEHVRKVHPKIDLRIVEGMSGDVANWLTEGRLDVAVLYEAHNAPLSVAFPLLEDELCLIGPEEGEFSKISQIEFNALAKFPQIASSDQHFLRKLLDETATRQGLKLNYVQTIDSIPQLRELVVRGIGYTILPRIAFADVSLSKALRFVPLRNPDLRLRSWLALTPRREPTQAAVFVHSAMRQVIVDLVNDGRWPGGIIISPNE